MLIEKFALITGASSGIGYELAKLFAKDGYNLVIVGRYEDKLHIIAQELKAIRDIEVLPIAIDLFETESAFKLFNEVKENGITIDILVNDAGQGEYGLFVEADLQRQLAIIQLNISSLVILTNLFLQDMVKNGNGKILNLSSIASKVPGPWQAVYHGTKAFVQSFTEAVREEVKDSGVTLTALLPGATNTDFFNKASMLSSKVVQDESQLADPADVAMDGYEALMAGKDMIVSGFKNKIQVGMSGITSDEALAKKMAKQQEPAEGQK